VLTDGAGTGAEIIADELPKVVGPVCAKEPVEMIDTTASVDRIRIFFIGTSPCSE